MKLIFDREAWADYLVWQRDDPKVVARINALMGEYLRDNFAAPASPSRSAGTCPVVSRRITGKHRLVYEVSG